ncbi:uncharacterized protein PITG_09332 [Phytophthora infestans T30-4]|uniref:Uncharacterized protein n=1 Tax=Phytophthora infestans (strain T30-4) TaxID=403677 RepID=D0NBF8_PHYIT|nr:uncharacterized protein PITG_09332 [Phytophthora infestans T30-4]EEY55387.1 conserved hypothetical protein [Phytophthora infestans T30-4]|eukprot:XP_002903611.1 conserved hypothetical protein [Phytophthora infestans T30-4]
MELVKPITSDHDLIELAKRIGVHLDGIFESNEIAKPLPKKGSYLVLLRPPNLDVGHWTAYGVGRYNPKQYQGTYNDYCGGFCMFWLYSKQHKRPNVFKNMKDLNFLILDVPAPKLTKALKTGKLSLTSDQLKGSGFVIHLHPASYEKALKAHKAGRGVRLDITRHEIKKGYKKLQGGSIWSKIKSGLSTAFKFVKDSGLLSKGLDAAVPALATAFGAPRAGIPARAAIKSLTGVGVYDSDSDVEKEGGRISVADVKKAAKNALSYAKRKGLLTDAVDAGEKFLLSKASKPEHETLIKSVRGEVKRRYGVGVSKKLAKGSPEMKAKMAALRAKRRGGSFRL